MAHRILVVRYPRGSCQNRGNGNSGRPWRRQLLGRGLDSDKRRLCAAVPSAAVGPKTADQAVVVLKRRGRPVARRRSNRDRPLRCTGGRAQS